MKPQPQSTRVLALPCLTIADGTIEAVKWLALVLMTLDHINKYFFHGSIECMFDAGRIAMPLFGFVLAYNLARPGTLAKGTYVRALKKLGLFGAIATVPFLGLEGLAWGWYPLNIMFMLMVATGAMYLLELGGAIRAMLAVLLFIVGGGLVEFWWSALMLCLAAWFYCRRPSWFALLAWTASVASLYFINHNFWALMALPIIFLAPHVSLRIARRPNIFYIYYPAHLAVLWIAKQVI